MRGLIANADDFGLTPGVNRGIIEAYSTGIVRSTTLMVNMPGFEDAVERAQRYPELAVGLHLNLTYGTPLLRSSRVSSLVRPDGLFHGRPGPLIANGLAREMRAELWAQAELFSQTGLVLSHLDTHHHIHRDERVLDIVVEIARKLGVSIRAVEPEALLSRGIYPKTRFQNYFGETDGVGKLVELIRLLPEGITEIPCHPGYSDDQLAGLSTLTYIRERELAALTDPQVLSTVTEHEVRLLNYLEV